LRRLPKGSLKQSKEHATGIFAVSAERIAPMAHAMWEGEKVPTELRDGAKDMSTTWRQEGLS